MFHSERTSGGRLRRLTARVAAPLVLVVLAPSVVGATPAQSVDSLRDKAARIAAEIDRLQERESVLDEQANAARLELAELEQQLAANEASYQQAEEELDATRQAAVAYAREAFTGSSMDEDPLRYLANPSSFDESARRTFLEVKAGDKADAADTLVASQKKLSAQRADLDAARKQVEAKKNEIESAQAELEKLIDEQEKLQSQVRGELAEAVRKEQERQRRIAEERARAQAEAEARRIREAAARSTAARVTARPSAPTSGGRSSGGRPARPSVQPAPAPAAPSVPAGGTAAGRAAIDKAMTVLGVRYKWAGASPSTGFDCSGLVMWAYAGHKSLPHSSRALRAMSTRISEAELVPGDLVFGGSPVHHVGIYIGNGQMVHAPHTGDVVRIASIYSTSKPVSFGRLP